MDFFVKKLGANYETQKTVKLLERLAKYYNIDIFFTGGFVRDTIIQRNNRDIDLFTAEFSPEFIGFLETYFDSRFKIVPQFHNATTTLKNGVTIDISFMRKEIYSFSGALPVIEKGNFFDNILRRDFTLNSIIFSNEKFFDPLNGIKDLKKGRLRVIHNLSFFHDPTRILRGVKFSLRFGYIFEPKTNSLLLDAFSKNYLLNISENRFIRELSSIFLEKNIEKLFLNRSYFQFNKHVFGDFDYNIVSNFIAFFKKNQNLLKKLNIKNRDLFPLIIFIINCSKKRDKQYSSPIFIKFLEAFNPLNLNSELFSKDNLIYLSTLNKNSDNYKSELFNFFKKFSDYELFIFIFFNKNSRKIYPKVVSYFTIKDTKPLITGKTLISLGVVPNKDFSILLKKYFNMQLDKKIYNKKLMIQEVIRELQ